MTDYSGLVNDLREYLTTRQISDLLEAQAKEIAELKEQLAEANAANLTFGNQSARISELEVALKELREAARGVDQDEMHYSQRDEWGHCLTKADEALKGEN